MTFDETIEIEICSNTEALGFDTDDTGIADAEAAAMFSPLRRLEAIGLNWSQVVGAQGQRILFRGWNGAHFRHRGCGWGTFDTLAKEQEEAIEAACVAAWEEVESELDRNRSECAASE